MNVSRYAKGAGGTQWYEKELNKSEDVSMGKYAYINMGCYENIYMLMGLAPRQLEAEIGNITYGKGLIWQLAPRKKVWQTWRYWGSNYKTLYYSHVLASYG